MPKLSLTYRDVTAEDPLPPEYPEWVMAFEELGFRLLGRVVGEPVPGGYEALAADYLPEPRAAFLEHGPVPAVVLAAPDGTAYVDIAWFWDCPNVRIRTWTTGGELVETQRAWESMPAWPKNLQRGVRYLDLRQEQLLSVARGRSTQLMPGADAATLWKAHRSRLAAPGAEPRPHRGLPEYVGRLQHAYDHELAVAGRNAVATRIVAVLLGPVAYVLARLALPGGGSTLEVLTSVLWGVGVLLLALWPLAVRMRYVRWFRPRYSMRARDRAAVD